MTGLHNKLVLFYNCKFKKQQIIISETTYKAIMELPQVIQTEDKGKYFHTHAHKTSFHTEAFTLAVNL